MRVKLIADQNPNWKGDDVGYAAVHDWITRYHGQPAICDFCGTNDPSKRYEWANISGEYRRDRSDYHRLCKKCHNDFDGVNAWQQVARFEMSGSRKYGDKPVTSRYKGVRASGYGTWRATFTVNRKIRNLGTFATEEEAARVYNEAVLEHYGEGSSAYLNEIAS